MKRKRREFPVVFLFALLPYNSKSDTMYVLGTGRGMFPLPAPLRRVRRIDMYIIAGLGNPGKEYENTRHNAGFMAMDALAGKLNVTSWQKKHRALCADSFIGDEKILLLKPQTYMNLSGESVRAAADYYQVDPSKVLIICDDINLEPGQLRIRTKGSAGGHNGLKNVISNLGTDEFPRIRIGVGARPDEITLVDYVLSRLSGSERETIDIAARDAADAVCDILTVGIDRAMNIYNTKKTVPEDDGHGE